MADNRSGTRTFYRAMALLRIAHGWSALRAASQTSALVRRETLRPLAD